MAVLLKTISQEKEGGTTNSDVKHNSSIPTSIFSLPTTAKANFQVGGRLMAQFYPAYQYLSSWNAIPYLEEAYITPPPTVQHTPFLA